MRAIKRFFLFLLFSSHHSPDVPFTQLILAMYEESEGKVKVFQSEGKVQPSPCQPVGWFLINWDEMNEGFIVIELLKPSA